MVIIPSKNIYSIENSKISKNSIKYVENSFYNSKIISKSAYESSIDPAPWRSFGYVVDSFKVYDSDYGEDELINNNYMIPFSINADSVIPSTMSVTLDLNLEIGVDRGHTSYPVSFFENGISTENESITIKYQEFTSETKNVLVSFPYYKVGTALQEDGSASAYLNLFVFWKNSNDKPNTLQNNVRLRLGIPSGTTFYVDGVKFTALVTSAKITLKSSSLDLSETTKKIGENNKNGFSIEAFEFNQDSTLYEKEIASENIARNIIYNYKNGKETAVIRCSVPEDLSVFEIGDEVIPMVYGADGVDRPMSRYKDGTQKVFNVVGTKFIYDGAVWQELTLQEKTQSV